MSRNLSENKRSQAIPKVLKGIQRGQDERRALQPQGSSAIRVVSLTGYQYFEVPHQSVNPEYNFIDLELANPDEILVASLTRSAFVGYTDGTFVNADLDPHSITDDLFGAWMEFDNRPDPKEHWTIPFDPIDELEGRIIESIMATSLPFHRARIAIKAGRTTLNSKPASTQSYLIVYQIRGTID